MAIQLRGGGGEERKGQLYLHLQETDWAHVTHWHSGRTVW